MVQPLRIVGTRPAGPVAGVLAGVLGGVLALTAWVNDLLLGIAVGVIVAGLVVCLLWAVPPWHRFGVGMLLGMLVTTAAWIAVSYAWVR